MGGTAVVDEAACSGGRRTTFARACQRRKRRVHRCSISCDSIADEAVAPYWGELSGVFNLAESLPPGLSRFHHFAPDESPAMAFARTFDKERTCSWVEDSAQSQGPVGPHVLKTLGYQDGTEV